MTEGDVNVAALFLQFSKEKLFGEYWPRLRGCIESLTDEEVWWRPNEASNSVGNIFLHLNGNVRQWLLTSFGNSEDSRIRSVEFQERGHIARSVLIDRLGATMQEAEDVLSRLTDSDLKARLEIQGYDVTGLEAVYHVVEHFGMHYGQIVYITKLLRANDLGFYRELDQTGRIR